MWFAPLLVFEERPLLVQNHEVFISQAWPALSQLRIARGGGNALKGVASSFFSQVDA